jgi:hypothetical protein
LNGAFNRVSQDGDRETGVNNKDWVDKMDDVIAKWSAGRAELELGGMLDGMGWD